MMKINDLMDKSVQGLVKMISPDSMAFNEENNKQYTMKEFLESEELKKQIQAGDIVLTKTQSNVYGVVRKMMDTEFDHVSVFLDQSNVLHISPPKVRVIPSNIFLMKRMDPYIIRPLLNEEEKKKFIDRLKAFENQSYDYKGLLRIFGMKTIQNVFNIQSNSNYLLYNLDQAYFIYFKFDYSFLGNLKNLLLEYNSIQIFLSQQREFLQQCKILNFNKVLLSQMYINPIFYQSIKKQIVKIFKIFNSKTKKRRVCTDLIIFSLAQSSAKFMDALKKNISYLNFAFVGAFSPDDFKYLTSNEKNLFSVIYPTEQDLSSIKEEKRKQYVQKVNQSYHELKEEARIDQQDLITPHSRRLKKKRNFESLLKQAMNIVSLAQVNNIFTKGYLASLRQKLDNNQFIQNAKLVYNLYVLKNFVTKKGEIWNNKTKFLVTLYQIYKALSNQNILQINFSKIYFPIVELILKKIYNYFFAVNPSL